MKKNKATENYYLKEPPCNHGNNALNNCSSYFDISQIKQLYAPQSGNGYEQIFSLPRKVKKTGRKSKKEISNSKGAILSFHSDQYQNDTKNPVPIAIGQRKKMKLNAPNEDPQFCYSNTFDQTPRKHFSFNHTDPRNDESPDFYYPSGSVRKSTNKTASSRNGSLNKYDFIRFVCSPTKKSVDNKSAKCDSEMCTPAKNSTTGKDASKNATKVDAQNESSFDPKGGAKCGQHVGTHGATNNDTKEEHKGGINNYPQSGAMNCPPNDQYDGKNQSSGSAQENTPQNVAQNNGLIDLDSHDSIDRLSRNFFINNKKIFITHFRKDKDAHAKRASSHSHGKGGNVPLRYEAPEEGGNKEKNEHNTCREDAEEVTPPAAETSHWGLFTKVNSPNCEDYVQSVEEIHGVENCIGEDYYARENKAEHDAYNEDDEHHNYDTRNSDEEPADSSTFLPDMNSFVRKNCNGTKSLYSHLDVPYNGSKEEIKKSYKEKIKVHHPDKGGSIKKFLQLKLSYDILTNDKKRKMYDKYGHSILELLVSEKFQNYEICSSDGENSENEIDEENVKMYDLFVQKYNNTSYLHNLQDLKMDSNQYNEFQKLIFHFFHHENPMFNNTFHLFPAYSPSVPPYRKKKTDKSKTNKIKQVEKKADKKKIPHLGLSSSLENSPDCSIRTNDLISSGGSSTSRNQSPSNYSTTKECSIYDLLSTEHITNLFNELEDDFKYFYQKCIVHKIEQSEMANNSKYGKKRVTKMVNPEGVHYMEGKFNSDDASTPIKEHTHHPFEQSPYDENVATPLAQCQLSHEKHISNHFNRNEDTHSFRDIQTSPIAYKIINENNERHITEFYRWFELFFNHHQGAQTPSQPANETSNEVPNHATKSDHLIFSDIPPNSQSGASTPTAAQPPRTQEETHAAQTSETDAQIKSDPFRPFQYGAQKFCSFGQIPHSSSDTPNAQVNRNAQYGGSPAKFVHDNSAKTKHHHGGGCTHFQTYPNATPTRSNTTSQRSERKGDKPNTSPEKNAHKITPLRTSSTKIKDNNLTLNIEEKYGFNLLKKSEQKIKDITHDFNYIYIGSNIMKKNKFVLFVKEESIKKFLKVKLLIEKIKKKSNLKLISVFEKEIEKSIKHMEYILLLITHKDEFLPLNDFYLLDKNIFTKDHYCIPLYIKKNSISRPTHFHIRWIVYTIQSLIFFNFFFKKVNKYMCAFPFFNYKYNLIKHFLDHEEEKNNTVHHHIKNFYIFFHKYIIKNKQQYLKYFPHSIIVHLKNDESPHDQSKKPVSVNMSSILVLTSNKPIPSAEW
ncbi:hypothetical protein AK88_02530 [Plasmodium fragile]|uniref:J domain-containing protein n=1 Tax=Plasmodium fragile TaxID=5857 RepID=A0A0D9QL79_PLAFR|nr:uncharacterized protein AK88_02530 [Plasmodium fragile]KJP87774.1 hypothetical protein AK88_02530 [Plasmodium fragile]